MSTTVIICTALISGIAALLLTRWMRKLAKAESFWLSGHLHVAVAALAGAGAATLASNWAELIGYALLGVGCALLFVIDLAVFRLPNKIVGPLYLIMLGALASAAVVEHDPMRLLRALGLGTLAFAVYVLLAVIRPGQLGRGDVKLAGVLGLFLGWLGWSQALLGLLGAFLLSAVVGIAIVKVMRLDLRTLIPFGPFMVAGAALGAALGPGVLTIG
ncbi:A24 family peptidase [Microlunatus ginsengisoli]|uniref:Prepilin type IV endopeptidase peptidase domain-containing protein n=1 Tax=Microlunatus ginsengisoli TaxID=363863 RepID=A0ABP7ARX8_9ACTN